MDKKTIKSESSRIIEEFADKLINTLTSKDYLHRIVIGHLHIESCLDSLLDNFTLLPSKLELTRMQYSTKVKLCISFGLIHQEFETTLKKIGRLRNECAHNIFIKKDVIEQKEKDLLNCMLQTSLKEKLYGKTSSSDKDFSNFIFSLWFYLFEQLLKLSKTRKALINNLEKLTNTPAENENSLAPNSMYLDDKLLMVDLKKFIVDKE